MDDHSEHPASYLRINAPLAKDVITELGTIIGEDELDRRRTERDTADDQDPSTDPSS